MKLLIRISLLFIASIIGSALCATDVIADGNSTKANLTDTNGHRQGYWKITGAISIEEGYRNNQLIEEGKYLNNKREGVWKKYFPTGNIQSEITYEGNHPLGTYKIFYPEGEVEEKGLWRVNRNTGNFIRYHENGKVAQKFNFNESGKRQGIQEYFYENGNIQMSVELENGVLHGKMKTFYSDGSPRQEKRMTNGEVEEESVVNYKPRTKVKVDASMPDIPRKEMRPATSDKPNLAEFKSSGFNTLYNINKQVTQVGKFINGRMWEGKWYRYDDNGLLRRVEIYKDGRFIGYGIIDDSNN